MLPTSMVLLSLLRWSAAPPATTSAARPRPGSRLRARRRRRRLDFGRARGIELESWRSSTRHDLRDLQVRQAEVRDAEVLDSSTPSGGFRRSFIPRRGRRLVDVVHGYVSTLIDPPCRNLNRDFICQIHSLQAADSSIVANSSSRPWHSECRQRCARSWHFGVFGRLPHCFDEQADDRRHRAFRHSEARRLIEPARVGRRAPPRASSIGIIRCAHSSRVWNKMIDAADAHAARTTRSTTFDLARVDAAPARWRSRRPCALQDAAPRRRSFQGRR